MKIYLVSPGKRMYMSLIARVKYSPGKRKIKKARYQFVFYFREEGDLFLGQGFVKGFIGFAK